MYEADSYFFSLELSNSVIMSTSVIRSIASIEPEKPSDTYFIKPPDFRPNSLFVGRETELAEIHRVLFDKKRRAEGTSAVLLQCLPGGGKSCLARQYLYNHLDDFPGGIFWVRAKSQEQLAAGFWDIACRVALKPANNDYNSTARRDPEQFITIVKEWFSANHEWLLVFDGIQFEHTEALRRFIPDSKNSSMIYTSTERSVGGDHHFMNPQVIRVPLLSAREAQDLFLLELDKKNPTQDDLKNSMELVQRMGFLPLVIHAVAKRLKATDEPLAKFARTYATGPKLRDLDTYKSIVEQLKVAGAVEALNLIYVLCFFSQYIPVEMVSLGLKALDISVKAFENATGRTLNNTIKILNRFALIDRREQDPIQSSQSSKGSKDYLSDDVDTIKLHSVVQDFFVDSLRADGELSSWLQRAVVLFQRSYEMANTRIDNKTHAGLVGDYRSYEIHGTRLLNHVGRYEKKYPALTRAREILQRCLEEIKVEIERRTRESSQDIAQGRPGTYQASIFDRTSSSSDTDPPTPGPLENNSSANYTWGSGSHKDPYDSPTSITGSRHAQDDGYHLFPRPQIEDQGYDSDSEHHAMTAQSSQRTPRPDDLIDSMTQWQTIRGRMPKEKPAPLDLHRTVQQMEKHRYHDTAGAWRAVNRSGTDPRVSNESVEAFIQKIAPRAPSRGRLSGQSQAEVALSQISKNSPPPTRGGGKIIVQDRSRSSRTGRTLTDRGVYLATGDASVAQTNGGYAITPPASTRNRSTSGPRIRLQPATPAMNALRQIPYTREPSMSLPSSFSGVPTPGFAYGHPHPLSDPDLYQSMNNDAAQLPAMGLGQPTYPRQTGTLPIEHYGGSLPLKRDHPHDYSRWNNQDYANPPYPENNPYMPAFGPESSHRSNDRPSHLGIFERDPNTYHESGYTSQPMSRDPSGGSARGGRSASVAGTEPLPDLSGMSPRAAPTSYEQYMRERSNEGPVRKSPRLAFARAAYIERVDEWDDAMEDTRVEK
jgi:hypothetical protein